MSREDTGMIATLMARADRADERADEATKRADLAVALADRTLAQLAEATTEVGKLRDRLDAVQAEARGAKQHAREAEDALHTMRRADEERKARGRWARLRAAWRGE
jgi:hypothetical protein